MGIFTSKIRGSIGEWAVHAKLNPLIFGRVSHRCIHGLILTDETGITHQIDEVEIRKNGIFCIEVKNYTGWVFGNEDAKEWTVTYWNGEKHKVYSPLKQNSSHVYQMSQVLGNKYRVTSLVVMANNNARKIKSRYVVNLSNLKSWLKHYNDGTHLSEKEMDKIYRTLCSAHTAVSNRKHIKNIQKTQRRIKKGICPRCGGELVLRKGKHGDFYGCANYPKCEFKMDAKKKINKRK